MKADACGCGSGGLWVVGCGLRVVGCGLWVVYVLFSWFAALSEMQRHLQ